MNRQNGSQATTLNFAAILDQPHCIDPTQPCYICGGSRFWERLSGNGWVCAVCVPPFGSGVAHDFAGVDVAKLRATEIIGVWIRSITQNRNLYV